MSSSYSSRGNATVETKGAAAHDMKGGDYVFLPAKQSHQFTCTATCVFYDLIDSAFDIHYVDKDGNEIPTAQLLKKLPKPRRQRRVNNPPSEWPRPVAAP